MREKHDAVIEAISEIERRHKDTSGGYDLPYQVANWMRQLSPTERQEVIDTLFFQFEHGLRYGYVLPEIVGSLPAPEYLDRLLRVALTLPHISLGDYDNLLSGVFGFGPEYNPQLVAVARELVSSLLDEGEVTGVVLLGGLIRRGIPGASEDAAAHLENWITSTGKESFLDMLLLQFSDFFPKESVVSLLGVTRQFSAADSRHAFINTALHRINSNPLLRVCCKWLLMQLERHRIG